MDGITRKTPALGCTRESLNASIETLKKDLVGDMQQLRFGMSGIARKKRPEGSADPKLDKADLDATAAEQQASDLRSQRNGLYLDQKADTFMVNMNRAEKLGAKALKLAGSGAGLLSELPGAETLRNKIGSALVGLTSAITNSAVTIDPKTKTPTLAERGAKLVATQESDIAGWQAKREKNAAEHADVAADVVIADAKAAMLRAISDKMEKASGAASGSWTGALIGLVTNRAGIVPAAKKFALHGALIGVAYATRGVLDGIELVDGAAPSKLDAMPSAPEASNEPQVRTTTHNKRN